MKSIILLFKSVFLISLFFLNYSYSSILNNIEINGNDRISDETIKIFIDVNINEEINNDKLNKILKNLYETDFFDDVNLNFIDQNLIINVVENPIIENISYEGVKNKKTLSYLFAKSKHTVVLVK